MASAAMVAYRRMLTNRANDANKLQEQAVADELKGLGMMQMKRPKEVRTLDEAPAPGQF